jgi:hypothetical protein
MKTGIVGLNENIVYIVLNNVTGLLETTVDGAQSSSGLEGGLVGGPTYDLVR